MHRRWIALNLIVGVLLVFSGALSVAAQGDCDFAGEVLIGVIAPLTGDIFRVGQSTQEAAELAVDQINAECGLQIGGEAYEVAIIIEDNESEVESSIDAAIRLIVDHEVVAIIGPQASRQAVPTGVIANELETPMISPWSTNPDTTRDRPWVFRVAFLDPFQSVVVANFLRTQFESETAAVLYDRESDYPRGLAENFQEAAADVGLEIVAFESFTTGTTNFLAQLVRITRAEPDVLFVPQYYNEVPLIVQQARELGYEGDIVGSDSWGTPQLTELCGEACNGLFFSTHYAPDIATETAQAFITAYEERYGALPDDVAALTYDAFQLLFTAIEEADSMDRAAIREALAGIQAFEGVTGTMTFGEQGNPTKCAVIVQIVDGAFEYYSTACPPELSPEPTGPEATEEPAATEEADS